MAATPHDKAVDGLWEAMVSSSLEQLADLHITTSDGMTFPTSKALLGSHLAY